MSNVVVKYNHNQIFCKLAFKRKFCSLEFKVKGEKSGRKFLVPDNELDDIHI